MNSLQSLVLEAVRLASGPCEAGHQWESEGGRSCPKDGFGKDKGCSQTVYYCTRCGIHDYGDKDGPAHRECFNECNYGPETQYLDCNWTEETPDACPYCSGEACNICGHHPKEPCEHDSLERHEIR